MKIPEVSEHVKGLSMPWELVLTKWLMCLFADVLPADTVLRVWDTLMYEGSKILIRVALTIIVMSKEKILQADNLGDLVQAFKESVGTNDVTSCHGFMVVRLRIYFRKPEWKLFFQRNVCVFRESSS